MFFEPGYAVTRPPHIPDTSVSRAVQRINLGHLARPFKIQDTPTPQPYFKMRVRVRTLKMVGTFWRRPDAVLQQGDGRSASSTLPEPTISRSPKRPTGPQ